jgi:trk system potassium uptake protein TrkA
MKQYAIIGMGRFGSSVARTLYSLGHDVLVIDKDEEQIERISNYVTHAIQGDATDESVLQALGLGDFDVAVVTIGGDLQSSILICLLCKEMGVQTVIAKAQNELHARVLRKIGVDKVVFPERDMGMRLAHSPVSSNILDYIELSPDYSLMELSAPASWEGKSLKDLDMRVQYGVNVMAIRHGDNINISPRGDDIIAAGDVLVIIGANEDIRRLETNSRQ